MVARLWYTQVALRRDDAAKVEAWALNITNLRGFSPMMYMTARGDAALHQRVVSRRQEA